MSCEKIYRQTLLINEALRTTSRSSTHGNCQRISPSQLPVINIMVIKKILAISMLLADKPNKNPTTINMSDSPRLANIMIIARIDLPFANRVIKGSGTLWLLESAWVSSIPKVKDKWLKSILLKFDER